MGNIRVSSNLLRDRAGELYSMNRELRSIIEEFNSAVNDLDGYWEGDAYDAFKTTAMNDYVQMDTFIAAIDEYCKTLLIMAQKYEFTERANVNIANKRAF